MLFTYKMDAVKDDKKKEAIGVPPWVKDGGHLPRASNYTFVGWCPNDHEYKLPDTVVVFADAAALKAHLQVIHGETPFTKTEAEGGGTLTTAEVDAKGDAFWTQFEGA